MKKNLNCYLLLFLFSGLVLSCKKDTFDVTNLDATEADPSFALVLGKATLSLEDLEKEFDNGELIYNENNKVFNLIYSQDLFEFRVGDLIDLPSQSVNYSFDVPPASATAFNLAPVGSSINFQETQNESFTFPNGEEIDSIIVNQGSLSIDASTDIQHDVTVLISIPYLTQNGIPFSASVDLSYQGSTPTIDESTIDLNNYVLDLSKDGQTINEVEIGVDITLTKTGQPFTGTEGVDFNLNFDLQSFESIWGYFGNYQNIVAADTQDLQVFENLLSGEVHFADPKMTLFVTSTAGLAIKTTINGLYDSDAGSGQSLGGPGINDIPTIPAAAFIGDVAEMTHTISNANTNPTLSELIDANPQSIVYEFGAETNPDGYSQNFLTSDAVATGALELQLPIFGYASNFVFQDTLDLDLAEELGFEEGSTFNEQDIESASLRLISKNGLPLRLGAQLYFLTENDVVLDSLFQESQFSNILQPGIVDNSLPVSDPNYGKVVETSTNMFDIVLTKEQLENLISKGSKKVIYKARVNTTDASQDQDVKFYPEYELTLKLSAKLNLNVNLSN